VTFLFSVNVCGRFAMCCKFMTELHVQFFLSTWIWGLNVYDIFTLFIGILCGTNLPLMPKMSLLQMQSIVRTISNSNAMNVRTISNSLVRVKYLTENTLVISHIDPNLMWEPMMYVGVVISVYDWIIAYGNYLSDFHVLTARGSSMICSYYDLY
jgi:hypothetical protein